MTGCSEIRIENSIEVEEIRSSHSGIFWLSSVSVRGICAVPMLKINIIFIK